MSNFYKQINKALTRCVGYYKKKVAKTTFIALPIVCLWGVVGKAQIKDSTYQNAVVVSAHPLASQIGIEILKVAYWIYQIPTRLNVPKFCRGYPQCY